MTRRTSVNVAALLLILSGTLNLQGVEKAAAQAVPSSHPQLRYHPEGEAIVCTNGGSDFNRPLYCNQSWPTIYVGDRPRWAGLDWNGVFGHLDLALQRGNDVVWLHDFKSITSRYSPGRMQWILADERFAGLQIIVGSTTLASGTGYAVQVVSNGARPQDKLLWLYGTYLIGSGFEGDPQVRKQADDANTPYTVATLNDGFDTQLVEPARFIENPPPLRMIGRFDVPVVLKKLASTLPADAKALLTAVTQPVDKGVCVTTELTDGKPISFALYLDCLTKRPFSIYDVWAGSKHLTPEQLDPAKRQFAQSIKDMPARAFEAGWERATQIGRVASVKTPDPFLDAQVAASCSAVYGLYVAPVFTHGGNAWRIQMPGWRMLDGATAYGWHQLVKAEAAYYLKTMITSSTNTAPHANAAGTEEGKESRFYGKGRIGIDMGMYNFQTQFMEELVRSWRHTADPELEALLLPALELHLEWVKECFDPDNDGLYESYINTWPTDSVGYNGGGTVEESAYSYFMHLAAAEMCQRKGDPAGKNRHMAQAKKINKALHDILWLKRKGHFAAYIEQGGHKRVHDDAWLYSEFLPIDLGIASPAEAIRALYYTEWGLERIPLPYGGELCHTSNWLPSVWSTRQLYGGDIYHLALTYFQTGLSDAGWKLLHGAFKESGYGDLKPKAAYGGRTTNHLSPGGLSHPWGSIDFSDISSGFCRALVEGMFGYLPDYPNGRVQVQPSLPTDWDHADINTPDYQLSFKRVGEVDRYVIGLKTPAEMVLRLPVYAKRLAGVTVNGKAVKTELQPWFGYGMAIMRLPKGAQAEVEVTLTERQAVHAEQKLAAVVGQKLTLTAGGPIQQVDDDQGCFTTHTVNGSSIVGECSTNAGHYAVMGLVKTKVPYWQVWKLYLTNPEQQRLSESKNLRSVTPGATWKPLDISRVANGDIRTIFKQDYASPRPATCSVRLARDGYRAWTELYWGRLPPAIGLENALMAPGQQPAWMAKDPKAFAYTDELTIDAWLVPEAMPQDGGRIVDRAIMGTLTGYLLDTYPGNSLRLLTANGMLSAPNVLTPGEPVRVTAVYSASKRIAKLYKNGKLIVSGNDGAFPQLSVAEQALFIGVDAIGGNRFQGDIQRVVLIPRALTDAEVAADDGKPNPARLADAEWVLKDQSTAEVASSVGQQVLVRRGEAPATKPVSLLREGQLVTPQGVPFVAPTPTRNVAFTSLWDNWPAQVTVPVNQSAAAVWLLVAGSTQPLQGRIANAVVHFRYADGVEERLELVPPLNFRMLCFWAGGDYNQEFDAFALGDTPPLMVQLGSNCRAMLYGWRLREGVKLKEVTLETLSQEVVVGLMGVSLMNPEASTASATDHSLATGFTDTGAIRSLVWSRPGSAPVDMVFRQDRFAGFSFHVKNGGEWDTQFPLVRVQPGRDEFALNRNGIVYSLAYTVKEDRLEVLAKIRNVSGQPFSPERVLVNVGVDTEMATYPEWQQRFFPTLLRCEKTHFWGYFMRPDGIILGIASPDPIASWANGYNGGGHRIHTSCLDLLNKDPQPARHPQVNSTLASGESRQWKIFLTPIAKLADVQPLLSKIADIPMIALDRPTVEAGQNVLGSITSSQSPVESLTVTDPAGKAVACDLKANAFSFAPIEPGTYSIVLKTANGKIAEAMAACRMPWSWYAKNARANAVAKPQKAGTHTESWYGLFSGFIARKSFPDLALDKAIDEKFGELAPIMYDMDTKLPKFKRIQNDACWASLLVVRYEATGDLKSLEFAAALADYLVTCQSPDGAYRNGNSHYTCVAYIAKSIMEVMAAEKPLAAKDPVWKDRYERHAASVKRAIDDLAVLLDNIGTEGEATYEDGMIACSYTQLAMFALLQTDPATRQKYRDAAEKVASGHRCLSQILIPDCRMNGGSLRYWESQYDIMATPNMMSSPHGWSAWRLYGLWYLYQLTGEKEYLRQAMNGLGSCVQLVDFKTGDLRWGFVTDPCVRARVFEKNPSGAPMGIFADRVIGEQYLPMISDWYRAKPNTFVNGYLAMDGGQQSGGSCDNDVHEIFKCLGEIALTSAYVVENTDGSLETWNCTAKRSLSDSIDVTPAEIVVSRVHFNLKKPVTVRVGFSTGTVKGKLSTGLTWFDPGGISEEIKVGSK